MKLTYSDEGQAQIECSLQDLEKFKKDFEIVNGRESTMEDLLNFLKSKPQ